MSDALTGVTVADATVTLPGPYATALLRRLGARVIKLEPPAGDVARMSPGLFAALNAGKESVAVDLSDPGDRELARAIATRADVFVEGWRPGVADRLGLGADELRARAPRLVYCSISGYGGEGALRDRPGHDLNYAAASGMAQLLFGERPAEALPVPLADLAGGTFAALRILAALVSAAGSGQGSLVDVSLAGSLRDWVDAIGGADAPTTVLPHLPHYSVFETADGHRLSIGNVYEDHFWRDLCRVLDLDADPGLDLAGRMTASEELRAQIAAKVRARTRAELEAALDGAETCWAFVDSPDDSPAIGGMIEPAEGRVPEVGEHCDAIRAELREGRLASPGQPARA